MIYIGIVGSRKRSEKVKIRGLLIKEREKHGEITVVSGGANGIDDDAQWASRALGLRILIIYPNRDEYNKKGNDIFFERNREVAEICNWLYAFPFNRSGGTMNTVNFFIKLGKKDKLTIID